MLGLSTKRFAVLLLLCVGGAAVAGVLTARQGELRAYSEKMQRFERLSKLIPLYPDAFMYPMGEDLHIEGVEREMAYAVTRDPGWKVADRYEAIWTSQGFDVHRWQRGAEEVVTATDSNDPWMRTIIATPKRALGREERDQAQTVILASVRPLDLEPSPPKIPVPEDCDVLSHNGASDHGIGTEVVMMVCAILLREVVDFYDDALYGTDRRFLDQMPRDAAHITYSGKELEVILTVKQQQSEPPRSAATITWQERR